MSSPDYKPLQTHGIFEEVWIPPKGPFIRYEPSDEPWARYCGIGEVEKRPVRLYDVRDERGDLVGYCDRDPCETYNRGHLRVQYPVCTYDHRDFILRSIDPVTPSPIQKVEMVVQRYTIHRELYLCWMVQLLYAPVLVECGVIKLLDRDRIREHAHELRMKLYKRDIDTGYAHFGFAKKAGRHE